MRKLTDFRALTFDTFGTLIDWETGLLDALKPMFADTVEPDTILPLFGELEAEHEAAKPQQPYSELLRDVALDLSERLDQRLSQQDAEAFGGSVGDWPAFPDSAEALSYLKEHFTLATLTNCDRASYRRAVAHLGNPWHAVYTAQDVGSYKPDARNFAYLIEHMAADYGILAGQILHVAQSLHHDMVPATKAGLATCWINRRAGQAGGGATKAPDEPFRLDFEFPSMAAFVDAHRRA